MSRHPLGFLLVLALLAGRSAAADEFVIDSGRYPDDTAARAAWRELWGTAPAGTTRLFGLPALRFPCNFAGTKIERASWDRKVQLDLGGCRGVQFKIFCRNPAPVSHFSLYFQSGAGWYSGTFYPEAAEQWTTVTLDKAAMRSEGQPAGWGRISTIRLSAWRGQDRDTEFAVGALRPVGVLGEDAAVAIVRGDSAAPGQTDEIKAAGQYTEAVADSFASIGIGCAVFSDLDVTAQRLQAAKLVVLPHNPSLPDRAADELVKFLNGGGKLLAFYVLPAPLRGAVQLETGPQVKAPYPGYFSSIRCADGALPGAPAITGQRSWNIATARPLAGRVLAEWLDDHGRPTGHAAIVASDNCVLMTHVLLNDDPANKRRLLLAMAGQLAPELWRDALGASLARIGSVGGGRNFEDTAGQIARLNSKNPRVAEALDAARRQQSEAAALGAKGNFAEALDQAALAGRSVQEAFCAAQPSLPGEFRAFWCHNAFGVDGMEWDEAIKRLADNGFTAILPNMLWGGAAFYPSKLLPVVPAVAERGDQIAKCVAACRKYGVQIHVWKVNWNTGRQAPKEFVARMRSEGRLQADARGKEEPWLCPSHPENQKLEIATMVEVARDYDVDGIHFDYIRYPDGDHCFCAGCRGRFAQAVGVEIKNWPQDVLARGPFRAQWLDWRRGNITAVVQAVSAQARALKPKIKISAAVFRNWPADRDGVGQDWKLWCEQGWLDFVCPMDYTQSDRQFENWVALQREWAGKVPVYPGIGVSSSRSRLGADRTIGQIAITRRQDTKGFVIFNYGVNESRELLPLLGAGITAKR